MVERLSLAKQILDGSRRALAKGITAIESSRQDHRDTADEILQELLPHTGNSIRIGISGAPGVGKSTFIESFGNHLVDIGHNVAVLAVDPSSVITGGSILGDKTRMQTFSSRENVFVRPSPAGDTLGGVTRRTRESMLLCEAAGFDVIIIETVGVGQSETIAADMVDAFILLLLPSAGDELQGIKRGITELADIVLVNKADGDQKMIAERTVQDYRSALQFIKGRHNAWQPVVFACSSLDGHGVTEVWGQLIEMQLALKESGEFETHRAEQSLAWMWGETTALVLSDLKDDPSVRESVISIEKAVLSGAMHPKLAARQLLEKFKGYT